MILDDALKLAAGQAIDSNDAYFTNHIEDLGDTTPKRDIGAGVPMAMVVQVTVAAAGSTDTTDLMVVHSDNSNLSSHAAIATRRIPNANLTAGSLHVIPIPPGAISKRYLGGRAELGSGDTVTLSAWLAPLADVQELDRYYASGILIDNES